MRLFCVAAACFGLTTACQCTVDASGGTRSPSEPSTPSRHSHQHHAQPEPGPATQPAEPEEAHGRKVPRIRAIHGGAVAVTDNGAHTPAHGGPVDHTAAPIPPGGTTGTAPVPAPSATTPVPPKPPVTKPPAPVVTGDTPFGGGTESADSLRGLVFFIPPNTKTFPNLEGGKPSATVFAKELNISPRAFNEGFPGVDNRFEWFAIRYEGTMNVSKAGSYGFKLVSDDGSLLYIDNVRIINLDGTHPPWTKTGNATLTPGKHSIRVDYFQGPANKIALQLFVTPPGGTERLWTANL